MFDLDAGKLIVIGIVALIAIPSKDLPRVLRTLGQVTGRMRRMAAEFQGQFMEAMREAELADLRKEIEETNKSIMNSVKLDGAFDPLAEARKQMTDAVEGDASPRPPEATASGLAREDAESAAATVEAAATQDEVPSGRGVTDRPSDKVDT